MKTNPEKFQAICVGIDSIDLNGTQIKCEEIVILLSVNIDYMLQIDEHVSESYSALIE